MEELLTCAEVAAKLKVKPKTVGNWLRSGKMRGVRLGAKAWRIPASALDDFVRQQSLELFSADRQAALEKFLNLRVRLSDEHPAAGSALRQLEEDRAGRDESLGGNGR